MFITHVRHSTLGSLAVAALLLALAVPAAAPAATVSSAGSTVTITAPGREVNRIQVSGRSAGGLTITDTRTPLTAGNGCTLTRPNRATCGGPETALLIAGTGPLGDTISVGRSVRFRVELNGGTGNDTLRGGSAGDLLRGNSGRDSVTYSGRTENVNITLAGEADDGAAGEGDDVLEVERATGGNGFDVIIGTDGDNALFGGPGDDRLDGLRGDDSITGNRGQDLLQGGEGNDTFLADRTPDGSDALQGGPGVDLADYGRRIGSVVVDPDGFPDDGDRPGPTLVFDGLLPSRATFSSPEADNVLPDVESVRGGAGADVLATSNSGGRAEGGAGTDVLFGGPGVDSFSGDAGFDRIIARDRVPEDVRCGTEVDRVFADVADRLDADCELRSGSFGVVVEPLARQLADGGLRVRVTCPPQAFVRCSGTLRARTVRRVRPAGGGRPRIARLGVGSFNLVPGTSVDATVRFTESGLALTDSLAPLRVRVVARGRDDAGPARSSTARLVLRG